MTASFGRGEGGHDGGRERQPNFYVMNLSDCIAECYLWREPECNRHRRKQLDDGDSFLGVDTDGCLIALDLRIQTNVLKKRKFAHLRLNHRRVAVQIVDIVGLEPVPDKITLVHDVVQKETAEVITVVISDGEENGAIAKSW
jgi:hypothetical protein